jgi:hypothetical protein
MRWTIETKIAHQLAQAEDFAMRRVHDAGVRVADTREV